MRALSESFHKTTKYALRPLEGAQFSGFFQGLGEEYVEVLYDGYLQVQCGRAGVACSQQATSRCGSCATGGTAGPTRFLLCAPPPLSLSWLPRPAGTAPCARPGGGRLPARV